MKAAAFRTAGRVVGALRPPGGWGAAVDRCQRRDRFQILVYHRVTQTPDPFAIAPVTAEAFRGQLAWLSRNFRIRPLGEILARIDAGNSVAGSLAITFDDGYRDNHDVAMPILRGMGLSATVFVATGFTGTDEAPWHDRVLSLFRRARASSAEWEGSGGPLSLEGIPRKVAAAYRALEGLKALRPEQRDRAIAELEKRLEPASEREGRLMMNADEVRGLRRGGVEVGAHTVGHPILSSLDDEDVEREISGSKADLERWLQEPVTLFAYPNGRRGDFDVRAVASLRRNGFRCAVTTETGVNRIDGDAFGILRRQPWESDPAAMAAKMIGERLRG